MLETESLRTIRSIWLHRITLSLGKGTMVREDLRAQMERFFELLEQAVDTGDPAWLDSIISLWAASMTETDLKDDQSNLMQFLREIMLHTFQVCRETLGDEQALDLTGLLMPCFAYAFEKASYHETQARVNYISNQLRQVQNNLEKLDRSKSDFIAVAAHELKTPLTLIEGYSAMLREVCEREVCEREDVETEAGESRAAPVEIDLLNGISNGTKRLKSIIDDMIDVSMLDNNLVQLHFQPVWINRILELLKKELEPAVRERGQAFEVQCFPGSSDMTFADPERLLQAMRNILVNAIKYTPDGGRIEVDGRRLPGFTEIIVRDSGIGIDPADQLFIFEKFARLGSSSLHSSGKTKFKGGGPGLGLHIAKGLLESHGGAIWVESSGYDEEKFPGSTFHILLPQRSEPPDTRLARLFSPLISHSASEELIE